MNGPLIVHSSAASSSSYKHFLTRNTGTYTANFMHAEALLQLGAIRGAVRLLALYKQLAATLLSSGKTHWKLGVAAVVGTVVVPDKVHIFQASHGAVSSRVEDAQVRSPVSVLATESNLTKRHVTMAWSSIISSLLLRGSHGSVLECNLSGGSKLDDMRG